MNKTRFLSLQNTNILILKINFVKSNFNNFPLDSGKYLLSEDLFNTSRMWQQSQYTFPTRHILFMHISLILELLVHLS